MSGNSGLSPFSGKETELHHHSLTVQELAKGGGEVPERFICKETPYGEITASVPLMDFPVIDLDRLSTSSAISSEELQNLQSALSSWGCFQVLILLYTIILG